MADSIEDPGASLQFERAEFEGTPAAMTCGSCQQAIVGVYYEANGKTLCERCRFAFEAFLASTPGAAGLVRAAVAGLGAAVAGALVYYLVLALTGYIFGLVAILVGFMVGYAVRWGTGNRGGRPYQALAILLTYLAIVSAYIPMIVKAVVERAQQEATQVRPDTPAPAAGEAKAPAAATARGRPSDPEAAPPSLKTMLMAFGLLMLVAAAAPFLGGFDPIGWAIIAFGLYQAWKMNRRVTCEIHGPFAPGAAPVSPPETPA